MPDAVAEMVEQRKGESPQDQLAEQRGEERLRVGERVGTVGGGHQPPGQQQRAEGERYAGEAVGDRQHRGDLRPIDLQVRRERTFRGRHGRLTPSSLVPKTGMCFAPQRLQPGRGQVNLRSRTTPMLRRQGRLAGCWLSERRWRPLCGWIQRGPCRRQNELRWTDYRSGTKRTTCREGKDVEVDETFPEIRESVRKLCDGFPSEYWRSLDRERAYPTEFVRALTGAGFLSVLIPEEYGGSGLTMRAAAAI